MEENEENKNTKLGNIMTAVGGLCTVLGLTAFGNHPDWKIPLLVSGVVLALYGVTLIKKGKK